MSETTTETRTCAGTTKAGEPCGSRAVNADGLCFVHSRSPSLVAEQARAAGIASGEVRREAGKSVRQRLADDLEAQYELVRDAFLGGMTDGDKRLAVQAASAALAEAFGRPLQPTREEGGMIFAHPLLSQADAEALNAAKEAKNGTK